MKGARVQITETMTGSGTLVALDGRLDSHSAGDAEVRLLAVLARGPVVVDLSAVRYVSSAGLRVLLKAAKEARQARSRFAVCGLQAAVREVFEVSGFDRIIETFPGHAEAAAVLD